MVSSKLQNFDRNSVKTPAESHLVPARITPESEHLLPHTMQPSSIAVSQSQISLNDSVGIVGQHFSRVLYVDVFPCTSGKHPKRADHYGKKCAEKHKHQPRWKRLFLRQPRNIQHLHAR